MEEMEAVNDSMAVRMASKTIRISRRTLRNHLNSGSCLNKIGRSCLLTVDQVTDLKEIIIRLADFGLPNTFKSLSRSVFTYVEKMGIQHKFSANKAMAGRKLVRLFLKHHLEIFRRKEQHMNALQATKLNTIMVNDHAEKIL